MIERTCFVTNDGTVFQDRILAVRYEQYDIALNYIQNNMPGVADEDLTAEQLLSWIDDNEAKLLKYFDAEYIVT